MHTYQIQFTQVPPSVRSGFFNESPFFIALTTTDPNYESLRINLYAQDSTSSPYQIPQNKWSHLLPQWGFFDYSGQYVESITPVLVEDVETDPIQYILAASAYYVDNLPSTATLIATLETSGLPLTADNSVVDLPSFSNSLIYDTIEYETLDCITDRIKITQDGKNPIDWFKWSNVDIPFVVTFHGNVDLYNTNQYGLTDVDPIVFTAPQDLDRSNIDFYLDSVIASSVIWSDTSSVDLSAYDAEGYYVGGFYKGSVLCSTSTSVTRISAEYEDIAYLYNTNFAEDDGEGWWRDPPSSVYVVQPDGVLVFDVLTSIPTSATAPLLLTSILIPASETPYDLYVDMSFSGSWLYTFYEPPVSATPFISIDLYDEMLTPTQNIYYASGGDVYDTLIDSFTFIVTSSGYLGVIGTTPRNVTPVGPLSIQSDENFTVASLPFSLYGWVFNDITLSKSQFIGVSNDFQLKPLERPYEVRRFNESWDAGPVIKSYALAEHTFNNPVFFDNFMEVSVGGLESNYQSLARTIYERIANFVGNHSDIDVCNLNQMYSIHYAIDCPIDDYRLGYPSEMRRLVDILSVNKARLLGCFCKCNRNFNASTAKCTYCGHRHSLNRGTDIYTSNEFYVSADIPFVVENTYSTVEAYRYDVLYPSVCELNGQPSALMSTIPSISWLVSAQYPKYSMYNFLSTYCNTQEEGLINWGDTYTTLSSAVTSTEQWYGDNGLVEEMLNYEIHRGLYNV